MLVASGLLRFACAIRHVPVLFVALAGCKTSGPGPVENTVPAQPAEATNPEDVGPALIAALADGTTSPRGLIDPVHGLFEITAENRDRRCGKDAERAIVEIAQQMKQAEVDGAEYGEYQATCADDEEVEGAIWCAASGAGEGAPNYNLLFVTNATGGVYLGGILVWENGIDPDDLYEDLTAEALRDAPCDG